MISRKTHLAILIFLVLPLFSGCKELYKFSVIQSGNDILFNIADIETQNIQFMLYDISVAKKGCRESSCVTWELVRSENSTGVSAENIVHLPVKYGQKFSGMETRQAMIPISTGEFVVGATFTVIKDKKIVGSKLVSGSFTIEGSNDNFRLIK